MFRNKRQANDKIRGAGRRLCTYSPGHRPENVRLLPLSTMATLSERLPENAPGQYYVDATCIDCDQCRALAPEFFARDEESGFSYVHRQPESADDVARVEEIMATCATASIGSDGAS